ncbi:metallophosphoesterase family protein [Achromobacter xylosoxidans]|uniref:metallophosphoesterase family protein n=1 Tax=Alcaligenes xylosoxydans xylosoxydans TaxID=85698 RepID=UPI0012AA52FE|nr:metallophosphoesterase family protein [Achromobacter xylosoxidans]CUR80600.1 Phosphodiesterase YfcE [Achromobacter xylosoxidans]
MLAILSDIHGNLPALQAVVADAQAQGCTRFLSLGDVAGYYAEPGACIDLLRELGAPNVLGNHDSYITLDENCPRSRVVSQIINFQKTLLTTEQVDWLKASHPFIRQNGCLFVHGGPEDPRDQYLYTISRDKIPADVRLLFSGHTHVQVLANFGSQRYCNPGSVGQPRDGNNKAAYAILENDQIRLRRVAYDIDRTAQAMKDAGFEPFCYENLYLGAQIGGRVDRVNIINLSE